MTSPDTTFIVGIDPGFSGAIAILSPRPAGGSVRLTPLLHTVIDMPTFEVASAKGKRRELDVRSLFTQMSALSATAGEVLCAIERVSAMPGQGVTSMFRFGMSYGVMLGLVAACGWPVSYQNPGQWKLRIRLAGGKDDARRRAADLWPAKADLFRRAKDNGRADAALIAYSYWLQLTDGKSNPAANPGIENLSGV